MFGGANNVELSGMTIQLEGVVQQLREISKLIESGFTVNDILNGKPFDTTDETKGLTAVKDSVDLIAEAINKKNDLFKEEEGIVAKTVPNETNYLGKLISSLKIINDYLEKIAKFSGLDLSKIKLPTYGGGNNTTGNHSNPPTNPPKNPTKNPSVDDKTNKAPAASNANKQKRQVDEISEAYKTLISTEKTYRELSQKKDITGKLSENEASTLKMYADARQRANETIKNAKSLTKEQSDLSKEYEKVQNEVNSSISEYVKVLKAKENEKATKENEKAANAYKDLYVNAKKYYLLLEKQKSGNELLEEESKLLKYLEKEFEDAYKAKGKYAKSEFGDTAEYDKARTDFIENNLSVYRDNIKKFAADTQKKLNSITLNKKNFSYIDGYDDLLSTLQSKIKELNNKAINVIDKNDIEDVVLLRNEIEKLLLKIQNQTGNLNFKLADPKDMYSSMSEISKILRKNTAMSKDLAQEFKTLQKDYEIAIRTGKSQTEVNKLNDRLEELRFNLEHSGKTGDSAFISLGKRIKSMSTNFVAMYFSFYDIFRYVQQGFETIRELDTAFTEMRKVSDESVESLRRYADASFDVANSVGATAKQIQSSTADFMRLGETLDEASKSAQQANILLNVSEFESIDEATESLVAMSAAYSDLEKSEIVDIMNNIGNNFAISTDELASALQKSAGTLKVAGNNIYEATALVTAGNAVLQDAESVGTGLKMISLRILGTEEAKNELASLGEDVEDFVVQTKSKIDETVRNYTAVASNNYKGISILDDDGNYKSTYEILKDISNVYQEILETDKQTGTNRGQALLEVLAGKNRSNVAASILQNPELLTSAYESAMNSDGSAQEELYKYLDSIEGKITQLKNNVQEFWNAVIDSDTAKELIDFLSKVVHIATTIVEKGYALPAVITGIVGAFSAYSSAKKGGGRAKLKAFVIIRKLISHHVLISFPIIANVESALSNMLPAC